MRIGLDFDDVTVDSHSLKPVVAKVLFGVDIDRSRFRREFVVGKVLSEEQYLRAVREVYSGKYALPPVPGAIDGIRALQSAGHDLCIVTNRSEGHQNLKPALLWLKEHSLDIPVTGVPYGTSKAVACEGIDLFVDDDPAKLHQLVGVVPHLLFFCWSHNIHEREPEKSTRVHSWQDVLNYIEKF